MMATQAFVCYCFWSFERKLKVLGHRFRPALPRLESMGTVETGVDLGAQQSSRVSLQMSTVPCEFGSELLRNIPARTADSYIQRKSPIQNWNLKIMLTLITGAAYDRITRAILYSADKLGNGRGLMVWKGAVSLE